MRIYGSDCRKRDFCKECEPTEEESDRIYTDVGTDPNGREDCYAYDAEHPPYSDLDYRCCICYTPLTDEDN